MSKNSPDVAFFLRFLGGGGAERVILNLARYFVEQGLNVDLVLSSTGGPFLSLIPPQVRVIDLKSQRLLVSLPTLVRYLKREQPKSLLSTLHYNNEFALWARKLAGVSTRVIVREANTLSQIHQSSTNFKKFLIPFFVRTFYPWADGIVAVSQGVAEDIVTVAKLSPEKIHVIYNPTVPSDLVKKARESVSHPWFASGQPPVILGVGKLQAQKDFPTLIRAFARVREVREAKLVILGWGPDRPQLEALIQALQIQEDVALLDHVTNPYAYMARSAVFVLSSIYEGLPNALIEAMAVGIPVIATDCKSGPKEILDHGKYGFLTSIEDSQAMADAILQVLSGDAKPVDPIWLNQFTLTASGEQYLDVLGLSTSKRILRSNGMVERH